MNLLAARPSVRTIVLTLIASMLLAFGTATSAQAAAQVPNVQSSVLVAAQYIKSIDPSIKESTAVVAAHPANIRARVQATETANAFRQLRTMATPTVMPMVTYWNRTYWFGHWEVAEMAGLSVTALAAILMTTGPITTTVAWGMAGTMVGVFANAYFSGYCAYYVPYQHRGGTYHC